MVLVRKNSNSTIGTSEDDDNTNINIHQDTDYYQIENHLPCEDLYEFSKYIPLRLNQHERSLLQVLESALNVSEYTDNVDVALRRGNKTRRILDGILEACNISTGLAVCGMADNNDHTCSSNSNSNTDLKDKRRRKLRLTKKKDPSSTKEPEDIGSGSLAGRDPRDNALFFQEMFEVGRRNKVLNPSKMRVTHGKLMHLLQDAQNPNVARSLGFSLHKELVMVRPFLETADNNGNGNNNGDHQLAKQFLKDSRVIRATAYIHDRCASTGEKLSREYVASQVSLKNKLRHVLIAEYGSNSSNDADADADADDNNGVSADDITRCLDSISDAVAVIHQNLLPVRRMLTFLEDNFNPNSPENPYSLQLASTYSFPRYSFSSPSHAPKLSHSHSTQYTFVWQTLKLWTEVMKNMHRLWACADDDLLSTTSGYQLWNTGQGLNRVQSCPKVSKVMRNLLSNTQQAAGQPWVGLSVIHLGDRDVPNALVFIDKYTQIPRFLYPIVDFIDYISNQQTDVEGGMQLQSYIEKQFQSTHDLKMILLADYFKHGFDGSGDDGGSCIDGRLTSSWNWTSRITKKDYYHVFMLTGFQGFDGDFK